jgi:hypothetical protein
MAVGALGLGALGAVVGLRRGIRRVGHAAQRHPQDRVTGDLDRVPAALRPRVVLVLDQPAGLAVPADLEGDPVERAVVADADVGHRERPTVGFLRGPLGGRGPADRRGPSASRRGW